MRFHFAIKILLVIGTFAIATWLFALNGTGFLLKLAVAGQFNFHSSTRVVGRNPKTSLFRQNQVSSCVSILTLFCHEAAAYEYFLKMRLGIRFKKCPRYPCTKTPNQKERSPLSKEDSVAQLIGLPISGCCMGSLKR